MPNVLLMGRNLYLQVTGDILALDVSKKVVKFFWVAGGAKFPGVLTLMNGYGEVCFIISELFGRSMAHPRFFVTFLLCFFLRQLLPNVRLRMLG